jgi:hypothetical protein
MQNVISMMKRKLNQKEQSEVYLTILETLAANYAEVRGQMSSIQLNLPIDSIKAENKNEVELSRGKTGGVKDRPQQRQWRRNEVMPPDTKALHSPTIPCGFLVDSWSIPSIPVHSQESLGSPGSFPPHSQFIPGPFPEQGGVGMRKGEKGGRVYEAEGGRRGRDGV